MNNKPHNESHECLHDRTPALQAENIKLRMQVNELKRILRNSNGLVCRNGSVSIECENYEDARQLFDLLAELP